MARRRKSHTRDKRALVGGKVVKVELAQAVVKAAIVFLLDNFGGSHERIRNRLDSGDLDALVLDTRRCILPRAVRGRGH